MADQYKIIGFKCVGNKRNFDVNKLLGSIKLEKTNHFGADLSKIK